MNECDDSVDKTALTGELAQPPQAIQSRSDQGPAALNRAVLGNVIDSNGLGRQRAGARKRPHALDHARFTAGVVHLYEAVLSEPIPEKMLRLIEEIGNQERKS